MANKAKIEVYLEDNASAGFKKLQKEAVSAAKTIAKEVAKATIALGALAGTALTLSIKKAIEFESAFAGVDKTVEGVTDEFGKLTEKGQQLSDGLRQMSKELPMTGSELASIQEIAGQLGVDGVDDLEKFTKIAAGLGMTTNMTAEDAVVALAQIKNVYGEIGVPIEEVADAVVHLGNTFETQENIILDYGKRMSGVGKIVGLTEKDILGLGTATASIGINAEAGATQYQKAFLLMDSSFKGASGSIINNTKKIASASKKYDDYVHKIKKLEIKMGDFSDKTSDATKEIAKMDLAKYQKDLAGVNGEMSALNATHGIVVPQVNEFAQVMGLTNKEAKDLWENNPAKAFEMWIGGLKEANEEGRDVNAMLDNVNLGGARGKRVFLGLAGAHDTLTSALNESKEAEGALNTEMQKRINTTESQMKIFKNRIDDIGITLGASLLPAINKILVALTPLIEKFADFAEKNPKLVTGILAFVTALGALAATAMMLTPLITAMITLGKAVGITKVGLMAMQTSLLGFIGTIASVVVSVVLVVGAFGLLTDAIFGQGTTIEALQAIWEFWMAVAGAAKDIMMGVADGLGLIDINANNAATATKNLQTAEQNLKDSQIILNDSLLAVAGSDLRVERAAQRAADMTEKYGEKSLEAREANHALKIAQKAHEPIRKKAIEDADINAENERKVAENTKKATENIVDQGGKINENLSGWEKFGKAIGNAAKNLWDFVAATDGKNSDMMPWIPSGKKKESRAHGGIVPGKKDESVPTILHGGERVIPRSGIDSSGSSGGGGISISFNGPVNMDSRDRVEQLVNLVEQRLNRSNELAQLGVGF